MVPGRIKSNEVLCFLNIQKQCHYNCFFDELTFYQLVLQHKQEPLSTGCVA